MKYLVFFIIILNLLPLLPVIAGEIPEEFVIPRISTPPVIDGILDDKCWEESVKLPLDFQIWPEDNTKPSEETYVYLCYDSDNIYIAFQARDSEPDKIRHTLAMRDNISGDDTVTIYFDTYYDQRNYYFFAFNPLGIQADGENGNYNWDTQLTSKGQVDNEGYIVEVSLPFTSIKFPTPDFDTPWGLRIIRTIKRKEETISWMPQSRDIPSWQLQEGKFHGFEDINIGHPVQIIPVIVTASTGKRDEEKNFVQNPFRVDPGINFKVGLTSDLTFDATINPDFSQVEADAPQIDVNTRFPLFIPEKRPFFLEGQGIFSTPFRVVHTRQIVKPEFGTKLTGKIGKNTLGLIVASDSAPGDLYEPNEPGYHQNALFTIVRMKRDILKDSEIGFILTDREFLNSFNRVYGIDGDLNFGQYSVTFQGLNSDTGDEEGYVKSGGAYKLGFDYSGRNLSYGLSHTAVNPDFEAQSGFIYRTGYKHYSGWMGYEFQSDDENTLLRTWVPMFYGDLYYDYNGTLTEGLADFGMYFSLSNQTSFDVYGNTGYLKYEGSDFYPSQIEFWFNSSYSQTISGGFGFYLGREVNYDPDRLILGNSSGYNMNLTLKFGENFRNTFTYSSSN